MLVYACLGACGAILGVVALAGMQAMDVFFGREVGDWMLTFASAVGAIAGPMALSSWFGLPGWMGTVRAAFAAIIATFLMGVISGTFVLPVFGTMFGPGLIATTLIETPALGFPWALSLLAFHRAQALYVFERDSIFRWQGRKPIT
ncbi:MAG: hypothetical protein AAF841_10670 [Pseudomonadota bacterium]